MNPPVKQRNLGDRLPGAMTVVGPHLPLSCSSGHQWVCARSSGRHRQPGGFDSRRVCSHGSGGSKSKINVLANSASGESSLPGLQMAASSLCSHGLSSTDSGQLTAERALRGIRTPALLDQGPPPSPPQGRQLQIQSRWGLGLQHVIFGVTSFSP